MREQMSRKKRGKLSCKKSMKLKLLSPLQREEEEEEEDMAEEKKEKLREEEDKEKVSLLPQVKPENDPDDDDDKDTALQYDDVSILFSPADSNATLNGLLGDETTTSEEGGPPASSSPTSGEYEDGRELLRMAMRGRERREVEKWVSYQEVSSRYGGGGEAEEDDRGGGGGLWWRQGLDLKLDHGEILKAWSDKGSLYVSDGIGVSPQDVPELFSLVHVPIDGNGNMLWMVGETAKCEEVKDEDAKGQREARVMRYKAKRQSRLFSKRIRYEVRKLNADKRPRLKGRFVKRG